MNTSYSHSQLDAYNRCKYRWWLRSKEKIRKIQISQPLSLGSAIHVGIASALIAADTIKNTNTGRVLIHTLHFLPCTQCGIRTGESYKHAYGAICTRCYHRLSGRGASTYGPAISRWAQEQCPGWRAKIKGVDAAGSDQIDLDIAAALELSEIVTLASQLLEFHLPAILKRFTVVCHPETNKPLIEHPFTLDTPYGDFKGVIDAVIMDVELGVPFVMDFKTTSKITDYDTWFDLQTLLYEYWLQASGINVAGSAIYQIRSSLPKQPVLTKKLTMNRTAISTTWEIYKAALIENGFDPLDYEGMRLKLIDKRFNLFQKVYRPADQKTGVVEGVLEQLRQMNESDKDACYRSISRFNCNSCDYNTWCMSEMTGNKPEDSLLGSTYSKEGYVIGADPAVEGAEKTVYFSQDDSLTCAGGCESTIKGAYYKSLDDQQLNMAICPGCKIKEKEVKNDNSTETIPTE